MWWHFIHGSAERYLFILFFPAPSGDSLQRAGGLIAILYETEPSLLFIRARGRISIKVHISFQSHDSGQEHIFITVLLNVIGQTGRWPQSEDHMRVGEPLKCTRLRRSAQIHNIKTARRIVHYVSHCLRIRSVLILISRAGFKAVLIVFLLELENPKSLYFIKT